MSCTEIVKGSPPDAVARITASLQSCFLGEEFVAPNTLEAEPEPEAVKTSELDAPCEETLLTGDTDEIALQKLLIMAGADPGPVDGLIGPKTLDAFSQVTGESAQAFNLSSAALTLRALVCELALKL